MPKAYSSVTHDTFPTKSQLDSPSACPYLIWISTTTTRSQSQAMSSPKAVAAPQQPANPVVNSHQGNTLHPGLVHAITNLMSHPLTSDTGFH